MFNGCTGIMAGSNMSGEHSILSPRVIWVHICSVLESAYVNLMLGLSLTDRSCVSLFQTVVTVLPKVTWRIPVIPFLVEHWLQSSSHSSHITFWHSWCHALVTGDFTFFCTLFPRFRHESVRQSKTCPLIVSQISVFYFRETTVFYEILISGVLLWWWAYTHPPCQQPWVILLGLHGFFLLFHEIIYLVSSTFLFSQINQRLKLIYMNSTKLSPCCFTGGVLAPASHTSERGNPWVSVLISWSLAQVRIKERNRVTTSGCVCL